MTDRAVVKGRLYVLAAAGLWSFSGALVKLLTTDSGWGLNEPEVPGLLIAFYRALFAGAIFMLFVRRKAMTFRPVMLVMVLSFAAMNALFVSALALGTAANAIILQYTAPVWMYLASVFLLGEPSDRRNTIALVIAMTGVMVIVADGWQNNSLTIVMVALGSGLAYAGVLICIRILRGTSAQWLTAQNHLFAALVLFPVALIWAVPTWQQLVLLAVFGVIQMALPYWLISHGLRTVNPQEAGMICLLEPILNPLWAYLAAGDSPSLSTMIGGGFILSALAWRYLLPGSK